MSQYSSRKVAVVGASGYSGEELLRLLGSHCNVEVVGITSRQHAGKALGDIQPQFRAHPKLAKIKFIDSQVDQIVATGAEFVFLALPHGLAAEFAEPLLNAGLRVLDLSADFRLRDPAVFEAFYGGKHPAPHLLDQAVYGSPEIRRADIIDAKLVACPGCYPTSILVPLIPLLRRGLIKPQSIIANSLSGVSGAGRKAEISLLFAECNESVRAYGIPKHRHLSEIEQELSLAAGAPLTISFAPHLIPITRGILTTIHAAPDESLTLEALSAAYEDAYGNEPFVRLLGTKDYPDVKYVARTNYVDIGWQFDPRTGRLILLSAEDNLTKGAAGQAVQCLNLMACFPETEGLV
jgi:N-acetyl-gamma-glutamyl-phosphate reductase